MSAENVFVGEKLLPVVDLLGGDVVRGIAGERESYRPLVSPLARGSQPPEVARALRNLLGHDWLYVADLDAIQNDAPDWDSLRQLCADGGRLIVDAGVREPERAERLIDIGAAAVVAALETVPDPQTLGQIVSAVGSSRTIFSLDLKDGAALADQSEWGDDPLAIGREAIAAGVGGMIVLDLAGVGVEQGVSTRPLCRELRQIAPDLPLITGGGVRNIDDVQDLLSAGINSVLIASALHHGRIGRGEIAELGV